MEQFITNKSAAAFPIRNYQYPRPGSGEVEEKIRLLDPSASPGGQGDCEGPVGRTDDIPRPRQLAEREHGEARGVDPEPFFIDVGAHAGWEPNGIYVRACETILGDEEDTDFLVPYLGPSCFNCGEPGHVVAACPEPVNRELIALSRQLFTFLKTARGVADFKRIHEVEAWRQQRLEWLDTFQPGEIRGCTLREALGGQDGGWLAKMALWGYPKGWVNVEDPREKVVRLIWGENSEAEYESSEPFLIYGDHDAAEAVYFSEELRILDSESDGDDSGNEDDDEESTVESDSGSTTLTSSSASHALPVRWATYPPSHFSSKLLPVYNGLALPPVLSHRGSATFTVDRQALWQRIISGVDSSSESVPPWKHPNASSAWESSNPPPPPTTAPPPIPPPPPSGPPPPLPIGTPPPPLPVQLPVPDDDEEMDMDMSD